MRAVPSALGAHGSVEFDGHLDYEAFRLSRDEPCFIAAAAAVRAEGREPELAITNGGLDANWLTAHGIPSTTSSDVPHSLFPLTVSALSEVRISVSADDAEAAGRIIESHRAAVPEGRVVRIRDEFYDLQHAIDRQPQ